VSVMKISADIVQLEEPVTCNDHVVGSSPTIGSSYSTARIDYSQGPVLSWMCWYMIVMDCCD
jgi:hypothetical protein